MKLLKEINEAADNRLPEVGMNVTIIRDGKSLPAKVTSVGRDTFEIKSELPFTTVKRDPMGGWRLKDDIKQSRVRF